MASPNLGLQTRGRLRCLQAWYALNTTVANVTSKALTGQSVSYAQGTLGVSINATLATSLETYAQGTVTPSSATTVALTGQGIALSQGQLSVAISAALADQSEAYAQGSVIPVTGTSVQLSGQTEDLSQGNVSAVIASDTSGQAVSNNAGTLAATLTATIAGQSEAEAQGQLSASLSRGLTGGAEALTQGQLAANIVAQILGQTELYQQGTVTPSAVNTINVALNGQSYAYSQGILTAAGDGTALQSAAGTGGTYKIKPLSQKQRKQLVEAQRIELGIVDKPRGKTKSQIIENLLPIDSKSTAKTEYAANFSALKTAFELAQIQKSAEQALQRQAKAQREQNKLALLAIEQQRLDDEVLLYAVLELM